MTYYYFTSKFYFFYQYFELKKNSKSWIFLPVYLILFTSKLIFFTSKLNFFYQYFKIKKKVFASIFTKFFPILALLKTYLNYKKHTLRLKFSTIFLNKFLNKKKTGRNKKNTSKKKNYWQKNYDLLVFTGQKKILFFFAEIMVKK